jgi:hypothetical protein
LHFSRNKTKTIKRDLQYYDYKRTQNTAMPTEKRGKEIKLYNATDLNTAAATILKEKQENKPWL